VPYSFTKTSSYLLQVSDSGKAVQGHASSKKTDAIQCKLYTTLKELRRVYFLCLSSYLLSKSLVHLKQT
jgi:hypothetical protein